jgi:hypothetical protein
MMHSIALVNDYKRKCILVHLQAFCVIHIVPSLKFHKMKIFLVPHA